MSMQIIRDLEQGSPEWHALRSGIVTMSNVDCLLVDGKHSSGLGAGAYTYMNQLIGERICGEPDDSFQGNRHTERGHLLEDQAGALYESQTGLVREKAAIILNHECGYSPDSTIYDDGLLEIKTKLPKIQVEVILAGEVPKEHIPQCQGGLWVSEREWIDFVSYWPGMPLFVKRVHRDEMMIKKMAARVKIFYEILEKRMDVVLGA
jgi:hypothetical protein